VVPLHAIAPIGQTPSPRVRLSGRAAHPSNQSGGGLLGEDLPGALSFGALRAIATGFAQVNSPVPPDEDDPSTPRSVRLLATVHYDVWVITWPDGSGLAPHDHGGVRSVLHVIDGEVIEIVADHVDEEPPRARILRQGETVWGKPSLVHDVANTSGADATTLHVYSPPLAEISFFDLHTDAERQRLRTTAVFEHAPEAGSDGLAPLPSPPLSLVI
jgi:predicted metal-dependent enzyme (double-stranded beta helix superfamily)